MMIGIHYTQEETVILPAIDTSGHITWAQGSTYCNTGEICVKWKKLEDGWTELIVQKPEDVRLDLSDYRYVQMVHPNEYKIRR